MAKLLGAVLLLALVPGLAAAAGANCPLIVRRVRLAAGASPREGRVELLAGCAGNSSAAWYGNLCQLDVNYRDSEYYGVNPDNLARLSGKLVCTGREAAVADCPMSVTWYGALGAERPQYCSKPEDDNQWEDMEAGYEVGAVCRGALPKRLLTGPRLVGGPSRREGRLEHAAIGRPPGDCNSSADFGVWCRGSQKLAVNGVRLAGGLTKQDGRVEVRLAGGKWGMVCAYNPPFDPKRNVSAGVDNACAVARAVCRSLGYRGGTPQNVDWGRSPDAYDWQPYHLNVACRDAKPPLRLAGGRSSTAGRVEVWDGRQWRPICKDVVPYKKAVRVGKLVCRQLGLRGGAERYGVYTNSSVPALATVACTGKEAALLACSLNQPTSEYDSDNKRVLCKSHLGVACAGAADNIVEVRLVNGTTPYEGRLEAKLNGRWGVVHVGIDDDLPAARLVCRELGLTGGALRYYGYYGAGALPPVLYGLNCTGAGKLRDCPFSGGPSDGGDPLGVACQGSGAIEGLRLVEGPTSREGRVEVKMRGRWGAVLALGLSDDASAVAQAVCRGLGYGGGAPRLSGWYDAPNGTATPLVTDLKCTGGEASLEWCSFAWSVDQSPRDDTLGVACAGSRTLSGVRLTSSGAPAACAGSSSRGSAGAGCAATGASLATGRPT
ncbi:deleted in malignant brain tumors 1 -like isoform A [Micractinium conductrix]|uniref:Deleted in malignant brain tumors 1 -like isoform A n=1 Tax=Micractinium conductrix TaxID=554055 RepID=A0A2P6VKJ4_9CHLO|nr:deleted in malignant brain tumors 1 -like isoform A [Micractinium conductrix]|eukprot:PSC74598.1 deleted in malignant brain tumors 1 -like isoform A [Micractinium conductrix]